MKHKVIRKQPNSKMCLVCGLKNPCGLKGSFYELENDELVYIFKPLEMHQGYPGRLHGGIISAVIDETVGRAIMIGHDGDIWGVTAELNIRFKEPVPLNEQLKVIGRVTKETRRFFQGSGELLLPNGKTAIEGYGKYIKLSLDKIADFKPEVQEWKVVKLEQDPEVIDI